MQSSYYLQYNTLKKINTAILIKILILKIIPIQKKKSILLKKKIVFHVFFLSFLFYFYFFKSNLKSRVNIKFHFFYFFSSHKKKSKKHLSFTGKYNFLSLQIISFHCNPKSIAVSKWSSVSKYFLHKWSWLHVCKKEFIRRKCFPK